MSRLSILVSTIVLALVATGCGGGGGGASLGKLTLVADFADPTRVLPGYADSLRVTVTPPAGIVLPSGITNPFTLTRASASRVLNGLVPNASPYVLLMEALTDGAVVGIAQRSVFVTAGGSQEVDVSANLQSEVSAVVVEGATSVTIGNNAQYTAYAKDAGGQTLFSGAGFAWSSTDQLVLFVDPDTGLGIPRDPGTASVKATLKGTTVTGSLLVDVSIDGDAGVTIEPTATVELAGAQRQFVATVTGLSNTNVTWSVDEPGGGTVSAGGMYSAPVTPGTYTLRATSQADPSKSAAAIVFVQTGSAWTVVSLHPAGAQESEAIGMKDGQQIGSADFGGSAHAGVWNGTAASWVDLHPVGAGYSRGWDLGSGSQVGAANVEGDDHASLWSGSSGSWIDLHPLTATDHSIAYGADGGQQAGVAFITGHDHAGIWNGTAASWIDLHPAGVTESIARDTQGGQQVGYTKSGAVFNAALWSGTAASWVNLQPEEVGDLGSFALAVHNGQQVGYASMTGQTSTELHASLWSGTAPSWVDLHPNLTTSSVARGVHDGEQVGYVIVGSIRRAALWSGTLFSWADLHSYVPSRFDESHANGIWHSGGVTYVVGAGHDSSSGRWEALLWVLGP